MPLSILITASVADGHMGPMLAAARHLASAGHRVRFLAGDRFADAVTRTGAEFLPWPEDGQVDHLTLAAEEPSRGSIAAFGRAVERVFIAPAAGQYRAIREAFDAEPTDVLVTEQAVVGAAVVALDPRPHPPVVVCGILPMGFSSRDAAPMGLGILPRPGLAGRLRNIALNWAVRHVVLRRPQRSAERIVAELVGGRLEGYFMDWASNADRFAQLTVPGFEYPRSDLPANVSFVGPFMGASSRVVPPPAWWGDLDGRRVVHVSQGTVANTDLGELIAPTLRALADRDVLVGATTGGAPISSLGPLPANARVAEYVPYDLLMPRTSVFVTNGGYGGLHYALAHGVPIVTAGETEDKVETGRRVEWSGVGVNLRTQHPTEQAVADAVEEVLRDPAYRAKAQGLAREIEASAGLAGFERMLLEVAGRGAGRVA